MPNAFSRIGSGPPVIIGDTPSWHITLKANGLSHSIFLKDESYNPFGSIKDRVAWRMLSGAIRKGFIVEGTNVFEASSGNTGAAVASLGKMMELPVTILSAPSIAPENRALIENAGARLIVMGVGHAEMIGEAKAMAIRCNGHVLNQYANPENPATHSEWTAPELFSQFSKCDAVFVCASSGGTAAGFKIFMSGTAQKAALIIVDPRSSGVLIPPFDSFTKPGILGYGSAERSGFANMIDRRNIIRMPEIDAIAVQHVLSAEYGINLGFSSGGILSGAIRWLAEQTSDREIVCVCPDSGSKYAGERYSLKTLGRVYAGIDENISMHAKWFRQWVASTAIVSYEKNA